MIYQASSFSGNQQWGVRVGVDQPPHQNSNEEEGYRQFHGKTYPWNLKSG